MGPSFRLQIITQDAIEYDGQATSLVAPGELGYLGILANHAPLITTLVPGKITATEPSGNKFTLKSTGNGFLEVSKNTATMLLDHCEPAQGK